MARIGIVLTGCGRLDGSDVHETVLALMALHREGHDAVCVAPGGEQSQVADHATSELNIGGETREMLRESARLALGTVRPLGEIPEAMLHGVIVPGGAGAFRSLCLPGGQGFGGGELREDVRLFLDRVRSRGGRIGAIGLASIVLDRLLGTEPGPGPAGLPPDAVRIAEGEGVAYASGLMNSRSLGDAACGIEKLVRWVAGGPTPGGET